MDLAEAEIRRFEPGDRDQVIDMILTIQRREFGVDITAADQPDLSAIPEFYQSGAGDFWVATAGGRIVGSIGLKDIGEGRGALRKMFVAAAFRGAGKAVASRLFGELARAAGSRGIAEVFLGTTEKFLAAHRFYEKSGFVEIPKDRLPASFPIMSVDTKFYVMRVVRP